MKKTALFLALSVIFLASCTKEKINPSNTGGSAAQRSINVEYHITTASANVSIDYIAPDAHDSLIYNADIVTKSYVVIPFVSKSKNTFSISARNLNGSLQNITVDIYVDGVFFKSGSLDHATLTASASGEVK